MVSLFALYQQPENEQQFLRYYETVHLPLAKNMPGVLSLDWGHPRAMSQGDHPWWLVAEIRFSDRDAMRASMDSPEGRAASRDVDNFAKGLVTMRVVEWR